MNSGRWDERVRRAEKLSAAYPFAAEILRFYVRVLKFQRDLYARIEQASGSERLERRGGSLRDELDLMMLLPSFRPLLNLVEHSAPPPLAASARELAARGSEEWVGLLTSWWAGSAGEAADPDDAARFCARAFLAPYAEFLAAHTQFPVLDATPRICPLCSALPQLGVLRPEGDGTRRSLVCSCCATEWTFGRLQCAACGQGDETKLATYIAEDFSHVRVEACDICRAYIKTVDLSKNGHAVPVVDEIAAIPLDLWAREQGYTKLRTNLMGM